ncbi:MAG: hypothetical protein E2O92_04010 [Alphaproteobacteria bacterium]|nr:MAG: hypothetical protein E2O92_04010 [Alphaproteobacteria bacterium]
MSDDIAALEGAFKGLFLPILTEAARGHGAWLFVREKTALDHGLSDKVSAQAEMLATKAEEIVALRQQADAEDPGCPAARYLQSCQDSANLDDDKLLGPQKTAQDLLQDLRKDWQW